MIDWYGIWLRVAFVCGVVALGMLVADIAHADEPTQIWTTQQMGEWVAKTADAEAPASAKDCVDESGIANAACLQRIYFGVELTAPRFEVGGGQ